MSNYRKFKRRKKSCNDNIEIEEGENGRYNAIYIPNINDSSSESVPDSESESELECEFRDSNDIDETAKVSYRKVLGNYTENQSKLEPNHEYEWLHFSRIIRTKISVYQFWLIFIGYN